MVASVRIVHAVTAVLLVVAGTGCATSRPALDAEPVADEGALRSEVDQWLGTPHQLGGLTQRGIDCSGLVLQVYRSLYGIELPRVTHEQIRAGRAVRQRDLLPGDLVFFLLPGKTRHVGIYLSRGEFAHASSSRGVMISHLDEPYWRRGYQTARRVLGHARPLVDRPADGRRAGW